MSDEEGCKVQKQYRVSGIEYIVRKGKEMRGKNTNAKDASCEVRDDKIVFGFWLLVFG